MASDRNATTILRGSAYSYTGRELMNFLVELYQLKPLCHS